METQSLTQINKTDSSTHTKKASLSVHYKKKGHISTLKRVWGKKQTILFNRIYLSVGEKQTILYFVVIYTQIRVEIK